MIDMYEYMTVISHCSGVLWGSLRYSILKEVKVAFPLIYTQKKVMDTPLHFC